jgi:endonuclease/exonuclease/phosphatase family metal-dependent hydrolase
MASECKVLTYNIFHDLPRFRSLDRRLELVAADIAAERPDVVALQEIARGRACGDMGQRLGALVNRFCGAPTYTLRYTPADGAGEGELAFDEGVALLSRLEPAGAAPEVRKYQTQVELDGTVGGNRYRLPDDRVAMRMRYHISDGVHLDVYVTHLTDRDEAVGGVAVRTHQARELIRWVAERSDPRESAVIAGDLNDVPESATVQSLIEAGFVDVYAAAGAPPGYTNDRDDIELESAAASHNQRIDYVLFRSGAGRESEIVEARLFLDRPHREPDGRWLWSSDHVGVMARLRL